MKIVGVNGIRTHGATSTDIVLAEMRRRGFKTADVKLPWRSVVTARFGGRKDGELVADFSDDGDIIVAHSFGCLRAWHAHTIRDYSLIVCIAPAMPRRAEWRHPERVHCWFSPDDWAVFAGTFLFLHPFGAAGTKGFKQEGVQHFAVPDTGHGDYFHGARLRALADRIAAAAAGRNGP